MPPSDQLYLDDASRSSGRRANLAVVAGCFAVFWPGSIAFGMFGVLAAYWQQTFEVGRSQIGGAVFFMLAALGIFMYLAGRWQWRIGINRMVALGGVVCGLNALVAAFAQDIYWIYLWAFVHGISHCLVYIPVLTSVQSWHPHRLGLVSGLVSLVYGGSAVFMAPLFAWLLQTQGYLATNLWVGGATLVTCLAAAPLLSPRQDASSQSPSSQVIPHPDPEPRQVIRTSNFWFLWGATAFMGAAGVTMVTLGMDFGISMGWGTSRAVLIVSGFAAGSGLGRLAMGWLSDKMNRHRLMSLTFMAAGLAYFILAGLPTFVVAVVSAVMIGFAFGTLFAVTPAVIWELFGKNSFGMIFGMVFTAYGFLAGPLGPALVGMIADHTNGDYRAAFLYLGGLCFLAAILIRQMKSVEKAMG